MKIRCCKFTPDVNLFFLSASVPTATSCQLCTTISRVIVYYKTLRNLDYKSDELKLRQQKKGRVKRTNFN